MRILMNPRGRTVRRHEPGHAESLNKEEVFEAIAATDTPLALHPEELLLTKSAVQRLNE